MTAASKISRHISQVTGVPFENVRQRSVGGGCINTTYVLSDDRRQFFVKTNQAALLDMFEAEFAGLNEITQSNTIKAPHPVCFGEDGSQAYLVMEYLPTGGGDSQSALKLGQNLAAMHRVTQKDYGWFRDNTIGSTPQINQPSDDWVSFWRDRRLAFQLELAAKKGYRGRLQQKGELLLTKLESFFSQPPQASLLHGDLWSGNYAVTQSGEPVIFDPAVYYGDRETDLAMTELFGGFPASFYAAYNEVYSLDEGYAVRKTLYNLYHIINHLNLFGGGYGSQAERMIEHLLGEVS
ncbi:MAG: fructosamine kinase family protein [Gammaproteobacteria bacterium]